MCPCETEYEKKMRNHDLEEHSFVEAVDTVSGAGSQAADREQAAEQGRVVDWDFYSWEEDVVVAVHFPFCCCCCLCLSISATVRKETARGYMIDEMDAQHEVIEHMVAEVVEDSLRAMDQQDLVVAVLVPGRVCPCFSQKDSMIVGGARRHMIAKGYISHEIEI